MTSRTQEDEAAVPEPGWDNRPLPRGRHGLPREVVRSSQRERLLRAMTEVVSEQGYGSTTVPKVVKAARVSTNTFYEFFQDKTDCFIALCEQAGDELLADLVVHVREPTWIDALDRGLDFLIEWWRRRDALTHAYFLELPSAGRRAQQERARQHKRFMAVTRHLAERARSEQDGLPPIDELTLSTAVIAPTELIAIEVREGRLDRVDRLKDGLLRLMVRLLADDATAASLADRQRPSRD